ncbi:unnamed protein product [Polarella glacialis]|uniref:Uncharacterized protein n=1 Tax=Polarella glacialis TaxID=89957 RepID=A0A813I8F4_POLGL|nr:unnamed protein product [Polarella glacialis]
MEREQVLVVLLHQGTSHPARFKFFRGTTRSELQSFVAELLGLELAAHEVLRFSDEEGDDVLLNDQVPSGTVLKVWVSSKRPHGFAACSAPAMKRLRPARKELAEVLAMQAETLREDLDHRQSCLPFLLTATDSLLKTASQFRRDVLYHLGPWQSSCLVFRGDMPAHIRHGILLHLILFEVVHLAEVSRSFRAWCYPDGRQLLPLVSDQALRGGVEAARRLAARSHPSFIQRVEVVERGSAACAFLEGLLSVADAPLSSLEAVAVANTRYSSSTLLIRLLKKAGQVRAVQLLTLLDRPLPAECLRSVRELGPLVLHATELRGFPSLFAGGPAATLESVQILDTTKLDFQVLLGAMPEALPKHGAAGQHLRRLEILPHGDEPAGRFWPQWVQSLAELLQHPALASLEFVAVPIPSSVSAASECAEALFQSLQAHVTLPARLSILRLVPYPTKSQGFSPSGGGGDSDEVRDARAMLARYRAAWPALSVQFPGIT